MNCCHQIDNVFHEMVKCPSLNISHFLCSVLNKIKTFEISKFLHSHFYLHFTQVPNFWEVGLYNDFTENSFIKKNKKNKSTI